MDQLKIHSDFLKNLISDVLTKKTQKYLKTITINDLVFEKQDDTTYKAHIDCDICLSELQISHILHNL